MALPLKEKAFSKSNLKTQNLEDDNCCIIYQSFVGILWSSPYLRSQSTERLKKAPMAEMRRDFFVETNTKEFWSQWNEKTHSLSFSKFWKPKTYSIKFFLKFLQSICAHFMNGLPSWRDSLPTQDYISRWRNLHFPFSTVFCKKKLQKKTVEDGKYKFRHLEM